MRFRDYFDAIYYINLDKRTDRVDSFKQRIKEATDDTVDANKSSIKRFSAVDGTKLDPATYKNRTPGTEGCNRSHLYILRECLRDNVSSVLILEDDVVFDSDFGNKFLDFIAKVPKDWDMIYLGGNHQKAAVVVNPPVHRVQVFSTHAYAVNSKLFPKIIEVLEGSSQPLDVSYRDCIHRDTDLNVYGCLPQIAWQAAGFSDVINRHSDSRRILGGKI